jgi:translation initiation factor IF-3
MMPQPPAKSGARINFDIHAPQVRLIDQHGGAVGVMSVREAVAKAQAAGMDLVEISPNAQPPVCKILDAGKFKYELQKKKAEARRNQKVIEIKEIKLRPGIEPNDYQVKLRAMRRFLEEGNKVKVTLRFRGRELEHQAITTQVMENAKNDLADVAKIELAPRLEGRQMVMVAAPKG